jgi:hypothetical protein
MLDGLAAKDWKAELDAMQKSGIDTIVIQWLKYDQTRFYPVHAPRLDVVETILSYADRHDMKVILFHTSSATGITTTRRSRPFAPPSGASREAAEAYRPASSGGVGTNHWEGKVKEKAGPYLTDLARAIRQAGAHPWVGIEIFATAPGAGVGAGREAPRLPAPGSRVAEQLEVATPLFERGVMFDFFHYMSPLRGEAQAALQRWFAAQPSVK